MGHSLPMKANLISFFSETIFLWGNRRRECMGRTQSWTSFMHTARTQKWSGSNYQLPKYPSSWMWAGKPHFFHCDEEKP